MRPHEERDFSPWLAENLNLLGEALGMDLELTGREVPTGALRCDLLARDLASGRAVVIENQFGSTNPDHIGKILTYAAGLEAEAIVWVAEEIREERRQTLEWLNRHTDETIRLFGVKLELLQFDTAQWSPYFQRRMRGRMVPVMRAKRWSYHGGRPANETGVMKNRNGAPSRTSGNCRIR